MSLNRSIRYLKILLFALFANCGQDDPSPTLMADFTADQVTIEKGSSIQFEDQSQGNPTSWNWTFEGGEPPVSNEQNPTIRFAEDGNFTVQLIVKSSNQTDTITKTNYLAVKEKIYELSIEKNIIYGLDPEQHVLDLYTPKDAITKRPLIIMMGGGGFFTGSNRELLFPFAQTIVPEGISVASARYRQVVGPSSPDRYNQGIIWCNQDTKAAVRFFRRHADTYNIDPNLIFIGGNSSGAIGSLVASFYDWDQIPSIERDLLNAHGGLEGAQGTMNESSEPAGIVSLSGEMAVTLDFIDSQDPAFFGVCANEDSEVACDVRTNPRGFQFFGAIPISERASQEGLNAAMYLFEDGDHTTPRQKPEEYTRKLVEWIQPILDTPPSYNAQPFIYYQDFNSNCIPEGWKAFSIMNESFDWACTKGPDGTITINSFSDAGEDRPTENWLVTNPITLNSSDPSLLFDYWLRYQDQDEYGIQLMISETHNEDFDATEWVAISEVFDENTFDSWQELRHVRIELTDFINKEVSFAIKYTSSGSVAAKSFEAVLDNFRIEK